MKRPIRVLHLEDDQRDAEVIREKLRSVGLSCDIALARGREDFESKLECEPFDLVLLDYNVPGYDGMQALMRAGELQRHTPVIVISGVLEEEEAVECLKAGATDYLLKARLHRLGVAVERALREGAEQEALRKQEQALRESEYRLSLALDASGLATWEWNLLSGEVRFSDHWWRILGYEAGEVPLWIDAWEALTQPDDLAHVKSALVDHFRGSAPILDVEYRMRSKSGEWRWIHTIGRVIERDAAGRAVRSTGTHGDVTERKQVEAKVRRLNRIYAVLSGINSVILRATERQALFRESCRIAVDQGGFRMAWIGMLDEGTQEIVPVAWAGFEDGFLAQCRVSARQAAPGGGSVAAQVVRTGKPRIVNDIKADGALIYRAQLLERGYRALAMLPLMLETKASGILSLYAAEAGVFDAEEIKLLEELAADVSFALDHLKKQEQLNYLAYYDQITGLPNRTLFYDRTDQILKQFKGEQGGRVAVVILDLDRFREINATIGRHAGDAVLREVARRLSEGRLGPHHLAHVGADIFAAVLGDLRDDAELLNFLEQRVSEALHGPITAASVQFHVSVRAGVAVFPADGSDVDTLFHNAEAALRKAKTTGDRYLFYSPHFNARVSERLALRNRLAEALDRGELELHYQPQVLIASGEAIGTEALLRWRHPEMGSVLPATFIPIAEETALIVPIGEWVLRTACAQNKAWQDAGLPALTVSVNLSALQFRQGGFVERVAGILAETGLAPGGLDLELTESMVMGDVPFAVARMQQLKALGVKLSMDDFGTGYSSLAALRQFPLDCLKMDRSFVRDLPESKSAAAIARAIVGMARGLDVRIIAEGVETAAQAEFLLSIRCGHAQGYLYSKPLPAHEVGVWLKVETLAHKQGSRNGQ